jgi:hypothetical protein
MLIVLALPAYPGAQQGREKTLYIWAGDQARVAPDFLAVISFDEDSVDHGEIRRFSSRPA